MTLVQPLLPFDWEGQALCAVCEEVPGRLLAMYGYTVLLCERCEAAGWEPCPSCGETTASRDFDAVSEDSVRQYCPACRERIRESGEMLDD